MNSAIPAGGTAEKPSGHLTAIIVGIIICLLVVLLLVGAFAAIALGRASSDRQAARQHRLSMLLTAYRSYHGSEVRPEQLQGHGRIYFVPLGDFSEVSVDELAKHFSARLRIEIPVLAKVSIGNVPTNERGQLEIEPLIDTMKSAFPKLVEDRSAILIGVTESDMAPRDYDWPFAFSWWSEDRYAVVSSAQMSDLPLSTGFNRLGHLLLPSFFPEPPMRPDPEMLIDNLRTMLLKDIGVLYYHLPLNNDPTSVLFSRIRLDFADDNFYESDLHPDLMPWGRIQMQEPCLTVTYSYSAATAIQEKPPTDCSPRGHLADADKERFIVDLRDGVFYDRAMDFYLPGSPPILFDRSYRTGIIIPWAFGFGASHFYNSYLATDSTTLFRHVDLVFGDAGGFRMNRISRGVGFTDNIVFQTDHEGAYYKSKLSWDGMRFHLKLRTGENFTYLPCGGISYCYLVGYSDKNGNALNFARDGFLNLASLKSSSGEIKFASDSARRISEAKTDNGAKLSYHYDDMGNLKDVEHPDGQVTHYTYDSQHRMLTVAVNDPGHSCAYFRDPKSGQCVLVRNEYDDHGRVIRQTEPDGLEYRIAYETDQNDEVRRAVVVAPTGGATIINFGPGSEYSIRTAVTNSLEKPAHP